MSTTPSPLPHAVGQEPPQAFLVAALPLVILLDERLQAVEHEEKPRPALGAPCLLVLGPASHGAVIPHGLVGFAKLVELLPYGFGFAPDAVLGLFHVLGREGAGRTRLFVCVHWGRSRYRTRARSRSRARAQGVAQAVVSNARSSA